MLRPTVRRLEMQSRNKIENSWRKTFVFLFSKKYTIIRSITLRNIVDSMTAHRFVYRHVAVLAIQKPYRPSSKRRFFAEILFTLGKQR